MPLAAATGLRVGETWPVAILFVGIAVYAAVGALSHQRERPFSASVIYLGLGAVAAIAIVGLDLPWLDPIGDARVVERIAEVAMVVALFGTGLSLDRPLRWRDWSSTARLLLVAMPLTIAGIALAAGWLMGLSAGAALLLGAVLAPTDPVLAGDIGVGPPGDEDEREPNFALTAEAGLNDALAAPFVVLGILIVTGSLGDAARDVLVVEVLYGLGGGTALGAATGAAAAFSVKELRNRALLVPAFDGYHAIATALVVYGVAEAASANGFVAAFAGGLAFRRYERDHEANATIHSGAEHGEKMLELAVILMLGSLLTLEGLAVPGWEGWLVAVLLLVLIRPLSCVVALAGSRVERPGERLFVAWFGVRGVGTLYYAGLVVAAGVLEPGEASAVMWTAIAAVLLSIVVHGVTSGPALRRGRADSDPDGGAADERARRFRRPAPAPESSTAR